MQTIQRDTSAPALVRAVEENTMAFLLSLGRAGGAEERDDAAVQWVIGGSPIDYHNCVVRADLAPEAVDTVIRESLDRMAAHNVAGSWHVGPSMRPADIGTRLLAHGFKHGGHEAGMAVRLAELREVSTPTGLVVERVRDPQRLEMWIETLAGFGAGGAETQWVGEMYRRIGLGDDVPWQHFLALRDGVPVATSSLLLAAGVAGIYFVYTLPEARRQGIGAAVTLAPLIYARERGYQIGVLGASAMGAPVYQRLGFEQCCTLEMYEWRGSTGEAR